VPPPLHGAGAAPPPPTAASHGQTAATSATVQTEHVDQGAHVPLSGPPPIMTASVDGPDEPLTPHGTGAHITPTGVEGGVVSGQPAAPSVQQKIPENTTKEGQASPTHLAPELPARLENAGKVHDRIAALQEKKRGGTLSPEEGLELHHSENIVALTQAHNLEQEQRVLRSLPKPRELDPVKTKALADAKAVLARPAPGQSPPSSSSGSGTTPPTSDAATGSSASSGSGQQPLATVNDGQSPPTPPSSAVPAVKPTTPPLSVEQSQKLIHNVRNLPDEAQQNPKTQANVAQARTVVQEHVQKLESQKEPLSEVQTQELAGAKAALARLGPPERRTAQPQDQIAIQKPKPLNSPDPKKWKKKGGTVDANWTYTDKHGNTVSYPNGYPDFKPGGHVKAEVEIQQKGNYTTDFSDATAANGGSQPEGTTWHHHENGTTMQAVDSEVHARFTHRGGVSIKKKGKR
jgi:hypothetical protein